MNISLIKKPSAWIPIAIPLLLSVMIFAGAVFGSVVRQPDEGTGAHIFQILMVIQFFIILYFIARWLPVAPKQGFLILLFQFLAIIAAFAPVFIFKL
jgi:MFS superfamily sulfate permease-like transporter